MEHSTENHTENGTENGNGRTVTRDQERLLILDDRSLTPRYHPGGTTIMLETTRDVEVMRQALEDRVGELGSLAKKNETGGYPSAARVQLGDRELLKQRILPQLGAQLTIATQLEPVTGRVQRALQLRLERMMRRVLETVRAHGLDSPTVREIQLGAVEDTAHEITDAITETVAAMHSHAYHAGLSERRETFPRIFDEIAGPLESL